MRVPRRLLAVSLAVAVATLLGIVVVNHLRQPRRPATVLHAASPASPEVAPLLGEAVAMVDRLVAEYPASPEAIEMLGVLHLRFGSQEDAVERFEECLEIDPQFGSAYHWMGLIARTNGDNARAAGYYRKALDLDPASITLAVDLADTLIDTGEMQRAIEVLQKPLETYRTFAPALYLLGQAHLKLKQYQEAVRAFQTAIQADPRLAQAYYGLSIAHGRLGDAAQAKVCAEKFRSLSKPENGPPSNSSKKPAGKSHSLQDIAGIYTAAGKVYLVHDDVAMGEELLGKACQLGPDQVECRQFLSRIYEAQGRADESLQALSDLCAVAPDNAAAHLSLGILRAKLRQFDQAEQAYRRAMELAPSQAGSYAALAALYLESNRKLPEAKTLALKACEFEPTALHFSLLAGACWRTGDTAGARSAIQRAVARDPGNADLRRTYELLHSGRGK